MLKIINTNCDNLVCSPKPSHNFQCKYIAILDSYVAICHGIIYCVMQKWIIQHCLNHILVLESQLATWLAGPVQTSFL